MKFHLNKIRQPEYLFSPRKNRGQRDNAVVHLEQDQYLTLDIKQFYPSTTALMVRKWFETDLGMYPDVARLLTDLLTIDDKVSFGSPLTPVLCTLVHRRMFDEIADLCRLNNLRCSLWVDDLTISGRFVTGEMVIKIRKIIQNGNLRSHKIKMRTGNRPVFITGIGVVGRKLVAPNELNLRLKQYWEEYHIAESDDERDTCGQRLLSTMGTIKHIVGTKSATGRKIADQMNSLRQKRAKMHKVASDTTLVKLKQSRLVLTTADTEAPF